jgi:hypothetical protein
MRNECANDKAVIFLGESAAKSRTKPEEIATRTVFQAVLFLKPRQAL